MTRHYFHENEAALQSAVTALPSISLDRAEATDNAVVTLPAPAAADEPADGSDTAQGHLCALLAAIDRLDEPALRKLQAKIEKLLEEHLT